VNADEHAQDLIMRKNRRNSHQSAGAKRPSPQEKNPAQHAREAGLPGFLGRLAGWQDWQTMTSPALLTHRHD
jgi:hypothetical protein